MAAVIFILASIVSVAIGLGLLIGLRAIRTNHSSPLPAPEAMPLVPGTTVAGKYAVIEVLSSGANGMIYKCSAIENPTDMVAFKLMWPELARNTPFINRFKHEVLVWSKLAHPNLVQFFEYIDEGTHTGCVMDLLKGGDLEARMSKSPNGFPLPFLIKVLSELCSGLQVLHREGMVHRVVAPANVLLTEHDEVKLNHSGIALFPKIPELSDPTVTGTIECVTAEYMLHGETDHRSDIYGLGILGYEMITGRSPFAGKSVYETMTKIRKNSPQPPSVLRIECPPELDRIVVKAMQKNPDDRYQSVEDMRSDLSQLSSIDTSAQSVIAT